MAGQTGETYVRCGAIVLRAAARRSSIGAGAFRGTVRATDIARNFIFFFFLSAFPGFLKGTLADNV